MEERDRETQKIGVEKSVGPTYTRLKCCGVKGGCTKLHAWTEAGECYAQGGRLERHPLKDE